MLSPISKDVYCLYKKKQTQKHTQGRWLCKDKIRNWSDAAISQGTPMIIINHQNPGRGKIQFFLRIFRESMALPTP